MAAMQTMPRRLLAVLAVLAACLGLGCARLSVSHLEARPLVAGTAETVTMRYWRFAFSAATDGPARCLRGLARPVPGAAPAWADQLEELTVSVYLRDAAGTVLASAEKTYPGMPLSPDAAVPFAFRLVPDAPVPADALSVSFGYKAVYGSSKAREALAATGPPPAGTVYFAGEGALLRQ